MNAMIFAAGLGSRLRPLTDTCPKALIEVAEMPILERIILQLSAVGIRRIVINVHHLAKKIIDFISSKDWVDVEIIISDETDKLLETGGGLVKALPLLGSNSPVMLFNSDIYTDMNIKRMIECYEACAADALLLTSLRQTSRYLLFDDEMKMRGWLNTTTGEVKPDNIHMPQLKSLAFGGVHILSPQTLNSLSEYSHKAGDIFSITDFYIHKCSDMIFKAYLPDESYRWYDIGKPATLAELNSKSL